MSGKKTNSSPPKKVSRQDQQLIGAHGFQRSTDSSREREVGSLTLPAGYQEIPKVYLDFKHDSVPLNPYTTEKRLLCNEFGIKSFVLPGVIEETIVSGKIEITLSGIGKRDGHIDKGTCSLEHTLSGNLTFENYSHYFVNKKYVLLMMQRVEKEHEWHKVFELSLVRDSNKVNFQNIPALFKGLSPFLNLDSSLSKDKNHLDSHNNVNFVLAIKRIDSKKTEDFDGHFEITGDTLQRVGYLYYGKDNEACMKVSCMLIKARCKYLHPYVQNKKEYNENFILDTDRVTLEMIYKYLREGKMDFQYQNKLLNHQIDYAALFKAANTFGLNGLCSKILRYLYFSRDVAVLKYLEQLVEYKSVKFSDRLKKFKIDFQQELENDEIYTNYIESLKANRDAKEDPNVK